MHVIDNHVANMRSRWRNGQGSVSCIATIVSTVEPITATISQNAFGAIVLPVFEQCQGSLRARIVILLSASVTRSCCGTCSSAASPCLSLQGFGRYIFLLQGIRDAAQGARDTP